MLKDFIMQLLKTIQNSIYKLINYTPCQHEVYEFVTNFYGDAINQVSSSDKIYRSLWKCRDCSKLQYRGELNKERPYMVNGENLYKKIHQLEQMYDNEK